MPYLFFPRVEGEYVPGVPQRTLTDEEQAAIERTDPKRWAIAAPLYVHAHDLSGLIEAAPVADAEPALPFEAEPEPEPKARRK